MTIKNLEANFEDDMWEMIRTEKRDYPRWHFATGFAEMLGRLGGVGTSHNLLAREDQTLRPIFTLLRQLNRLDLCMEYYVLLPAYHSLFSDEERKTAKRRLETGA